jgi:hypothetical protein
MSKLKGYDIELRTKRQLFLWAHKFLGWPSQDNRWLYPEIFDWDWNEAEQNYTIPAYINFLINPTLHLSFEQHRNFQHHMNHMTETRYEYDWLKDPGTVWMIRRHINYRYEYFNPRNFEVPKHEVSRWYSTLEWERQLERWAAEQSMNGGKPA